MSKYKIILSGGATTITIIIITIITISIIITNKTQGFLRIRL